MKRLQQNSRQGQIGTDFENRRANKESRGLEPAYFRANWFALRTYQRGIESVLRPYADGRKQLAAKAIRIRQTQAQA